MRQKLTALKSPLSRLAPTARPLDVGAQALRRVSSWKWEQVRQRILTRDCGLCQVCAANARVTLGSEVDHIAPISEGGSDADANLQTICPPCHKAKTASEAASGSSRWEGGAILSRP